MQHMTAALPGIERLNSECFCLSLDSTALRAALESELGEPGLIEINTNAGGAMPNAVLARAQIACCPPMAAVQEILAGNYVAQALVAPGERLRRCTARRRTSGPSGRQWAP